MHLEVLVFKLSYGRGVRLTFVYRERGVAALPELYHASLLIRKEFSCRGEGMYGIVNHCLSNESTASGRCRVTIRLTRLCSVFDHVHCRFVRGLFIAEYSMSRVNLIRVRCSQY